MYDSSALHLKYRPKNLDEVIGHDSAVSKLKGIISSGKYPSCIAFFGPTSVGKTTIARAFASSVIGKPVFEGHSDWFELNATEKKSIEDIRELIAVSKLRPINGKRRFLMVDEAQGLLSNPQAAAAWLKPLEEPPKTTTWLIGSMDPDKFSSTKNGAAILTRSLQIHLKKPDEVSLIKQATRIIKGEGLTYFTKELRAKVVEHCNSEMRTLANLIQSVMAYYDGLEEKPDKLGEDAFEEALSANESNDDVTAVKLLTAVYARKFGAAQRTLLDIDDGFGFIKKLGYLNWFLLNDLVLKGQKHQKVWGTKSGFALKNNLDSLLSGETATTKMQAYGLVQTALGRLQQQATAFAMPEQMAVSQFSFEVIETLKKILKAD